MAWAGASNPGAAGEDLSPRGAREHNLQNIDAAFPLGAFTCVTGVSGSGKSTLVNEILYKACARVLYRTLERPGEYDSIDGAALLDSVNGHAKLRVSDVAPRGRFGTVIRAEGALGWRLERRRRSAK